MARQSRWDWLSKWFRSSKPKKLRPKLVVGFIRREKTTFVVCGVEYYAYTKSEARAMAKKKTGKRLPVGATK